MKMNTPSVKDLLNLDGEKCPYGAIVDLIDGHPLYDFGAERVGVAWPGGHCVYFLLSDDGWEYVGQTRFLRARIEQHRPNKNFSRVLAIALQEDISFSIKESDLNLGRDLETHYIRVLSPRYNKTMAGKIEKYTPPRYAA
jgi:hypothetical protein